MAGCCEVYEEKVDEKYCPEKVVLGVKQLSFVIDNKVVLLAKISFCGESSSGYTNRIRQM